MTRPDPQVEPVRADRTHPLDLVSLVAGVIAAGVAVPYLLGELTALQVRPGLVVAFAAAALAAAGMLAGARRAVRGRST